MNVAETEAQVAKQELAEVKGLLTKEQQESRAKDERIQKLEKRLLFVAKVNDSGRCDVCPMTTMVLGARGMYERAQLILS